MLSLDKETAFWVSPGQYLKYLHRQVLCYKCRGCEKKTTLPVSTRPGACGECGRELPLKAWKDANMPGKEVVQVALQQWCS